MDLEKYKLKLAKYLKRKSKIELYIFDPIRNFVYSKLRELTLKVPRTFLDPIDNLLVSYHKVKWYLTMIYVNFYLSIFYYFFLLVFFINSILPIILHYILYYDRGFFIILFHILADLKELLEHFII